MSFSVLDFATRFTNDIARPNRFRVMIGSEDISIKCHTCSLPARGIMTHEVRSNSAPIKFPYSQSYDPVTFSFYADGNLDSRRYFDEWHSDIVDFAQNTLSFFSEYTKDVDIEVLNRKGEPTYKVRLYTAWPMNIGVVDYSYGNTNSFQNITATLSYTYWEPI